MIHSKLSTFVGHCPQQNDGTMVVAEEVFPHLHYTCIQKAICCKLYKRTCYTSLKKNLCDKNM